MVCKWPGNAVPRGWRRWGSFGFNLLHASTALALTSMVMAQDRAAIEQLMKSAMPPGAACSKGQRPSICEFRKGSIDYDIEYSHVGEGHALATIKFTDKHEYRRYLDLLMNFFAALGVSRAFIDSCVAEALEATTRNTTGRADVRNKKFLLSCDFYGEGNATFKAFALVLELSRRGQF